MSPCPAGRSSLDSLYEVVWATSCQTSVLEYVAQPLGLPAWPVLSWPPAPVSRRAGGRGWVVHKAAAIAEHLRADPRPFAWADDDLYRLTPPRPILQLGLQHLLIRPHRLAGLTAQHVDELLQFAAQPDAPAAGKGQ
ncbi:MAG: hypothetical protein JO243_12220 [Solirubrobacterales bacterium]|nr:hypothetical protein [Solirubrobacterales bacterium]